MRCGARAVGGMLMGGCLGLALVAGNAGAQCVVPTALASGTVATASASPQPYSFNQSSGFYSAVAVRPAAGSDWNIDVFQSQAAFPTCLSTVLGSSVRTAGVDFVIADFRTTHTPIGIYYPQAARVGGAGSATVEWDSGANNILVNDPLLSRSTGASDVIEVWDVALNAGSTYTFTFNRTGADLKLLLFKSGPGAYWAGRDAKLLEATGTTTYTVPGGATGFYGVVVINDDGAAGSYTLGVGRCETPTALISGTTASPTTKAEAYYSFNQPADFFWTAVGVRGTSDWNIEAYGSLSGGSYPACFGGPLGSSALAAGNVDFVVANFNVAVLAAPYYVRAYLNQGIGSGTGTVEWDNGGNLSDIIDPGGPPPGGPPATSTLTRTTGATDVLECWDLYLTQGTQYQFYLTSTGPAVKMFLLPANLVWGSRSDAILQVTPSLTAAPFVATMTGFHGLVVVNEDGTAGSYNLRIYEQGAVAVEAATPAATDLSGIVPNPSRGPVQIRFALHEPGAVGFQMLDVAGRVVSETAEREWSAGRWSLAWDGRSSSGSRLAAGIYFLRMKVAGRPLGIRKFALVE